MFLLMTRQTNKPRRNGRTGRRAEPGQTPRPNKAGRGEAGALSASCDPARAPSRTFPTSTSSSLRKHNHPDPLALLSTNAKQLFFFLAAPGRRVAMLARWRWPSDPRLGWFLSAPRQTAGLACCIDASCLLPWPPAAAGLACHAASTSQQLHGIDGVDVRFALAAGVRLVY